MTDPMKSTCYISCLLAIQTLSAACQPTNGFPPGVPHPIGPDGKWNHKGMMFTTEAYQKEAFRLLLAEANDVADRLHLKEKFPISESNIVQAYISPFGIAYVERGIGCVDTTNYSYCVSKDYKFCYLIAKRLPERMQEYQTRYLWSKTLFDPDGAYQLATQWLAAVSMDVKGMNHDLRLIIKADDDYIRAPRGKFVPVYDVTWCSRWKPTRGVVEENHSQWEAVVSVQLFAPTKTLLQLCVEDPKYVLRRPLTFTNLASLLSKTNTSVMTESEKKILIHIPGQEQSVRP